MSSTSSTSIDSSKPAHVSVPPTTSASTSVPLTSIIEDQSAFFKNFDSTGKFVMLILGLLAIILVILLVFTFVSMSNPNPSTMGGVTSPSYQ